MLTYSNKLQVKGKKIINRRGATHAIREKHIQKLGRKQNTTIEVGRGRQQFKGKKKKEEHELKKIQP